MGRRRMYTEQEGAVWRKHTDGWSVRQIEAALGIPKSIVHRMIMRRRKKD